jgi:hypothetical protein
MRTSHRKGIRMPFLGLAAATALSLAAPVSAADSPAPQAALPALPVTAAGKASLQIQHFADGTFFVALGTAFLNVSVAQKMPDGSVRTACVDSPAGAEALLNAAPAFETR